MQPVEAAGRQEGRDRLRAAFDQDAVQAAFLQGVDDRGRLDAAVGIRQGDRLDAAIDRPALPPRDDDAMHAVGGEGARLDRQRAARVDHHAYRAGALDMTHRELGIVDAHRAGADHHGVDQRA